MNLMEAMYNVHLYCKNGRKEANFCSRHCLLNKANHGCCLYTLYNLVDNLNVHKIDTYVSERTLFESLCMIAFHCGNGEIEERNDGSACCWKGNDCPLYKANYNDSYRYSSCPIRLNQDLRHKLLNSYAQYAYKRIFKRDKRSSCISSIFKQKK